MNDFTFDQVRYLTSKKTVDDRALNRNVWGSLMAAMSQCPSESLHMAELGAGTGSTLERLIEWRFFADLAAARGHRSETTAFRLDLIDNDSRSLERARSRVPALAQAHDWDCMETLQGWRLHHSSVDLDVRFFVKDVHELAHDNPDRTYDLLIAHAFLDLFHLPTIMPMMLQTVAPGGLFYFTINYDGATIFEPVLDRSLDDAIQASYNNTMDNRVTAGRPSGDSTTGRHLYHVVTACGAEVLDFGGSDWVVFPRSGTYRGDEEYFLRSILWLVEQALRASGDVPTGSIDRWVRQREDQLHARELIYIAHQLDVLGRVANPVSGP